MVAAAQLGIDAAVELLLTALGITVLGLLFLEGLYLIAVAVLFARDRHVGPDPRFWAVAVAASLGLGATSGSLDAASPLDATTVTQGPRQEAARAGATYHPAAPLGLDLYFPVPESNPLTTAKVALGERLFFDPALSADRSVACVSCHRPARAFSDTLPLSRGVHGRQTARNVPSIVNRAYGTGFFRDGRAPTLEETVLQPIQNPVEMDLSLGELLTRLRGSETYARLFAAAFEDGITELNLAAALASYVRTIRSGNAPIDRFLSGEREALSPAAETGFRLFVSRGNCSVCHVGPTFSDEQFHNTGVFVGSADLGRFEVTGRDADRGAFKTPTLRNVSLTAPYMHDGSIATLEDVIEFYDGGGRANPSLDREIRPLGLTEVEKVELLAFLRALTSETTTP